jgi:polar amino acid transport system substrate-binding protein
MWNNVLGTLHVRRFSATISGMQWVRIPGVIALASALLASACAVSQQGAAEREAVAALVPTGKLRVGVYTGSPTSYVPGQGDAAPRGVAYELGAKLAKAANVPFEPVIFPSNDKVLEAMRAGSLDLVLTNASAARAQFIDFSKPVLEVEKGYLIGPRSPVKDATDIDRAGVRIGVSRGSSTEVELAQIIKSATLVPMPSLAEARRALSEGGLDAFGTNKAILFEMSDGIPGSRVIGNWGAESIAFGLPKGRPAALAYLGRFVEEERRNGGVAVAAQRAGLRGLKQ